MRWITVTAVFTALLMQSSGTLAESTADAAEAGHQHAARSAGSSVRAAPDPAVSVGQAIYRRGALASGKPVEARRGEGMLTRGADAACTNCHQRSGLGSKEGLSFIPPVAGPYLFHPPVKSVEDLDLPYVEGLRPNREPYTDETLARAIREGLGSNGKPLSYLMPRYTLGDSDMAALIAYLKSLDLRKVPGVTDTALQFATIITPDADPVARRGMLDVLEHYFAERNAVQRFRSARLHSNRSMMTMFHVVRRWELHVWELTGPAATWEAQLKQHMAKEPVFAVLSGLGGRNWVPVHDFCEHAAVPCLFPNVEVPVGDSHDFYSLYFSRGVLLEAELIADRILPPEGGRRPRVVEQIYRAGDNGEAAGRALAAALNGHGVAVHSTSVAAGAPARSISEAVRKASSADALVLWLRPGDVEALGDVPAAHTAVFMSGLMGGLERSPLPASWRERTLIAYPFDLPEKRIVRVDYPLGWFRIRKIPVVAEQVQTDTYLACGLLSEVLSHMVDTFVRDYLVERIEEMLEHRVITGYYPHLALSTGQRYASKGGYLVQFAEPTGSKIVAESDWRVP